MKTNIKIAVIALLAVGIAYRIDPVRRVMIGA